MKPPFDASRALGHVGAFAFPRRTGTAGQLRIEEAVRLGMSAIGLRVSRQAFAFTPRRAEALRRVGPLAAVFLYCGAALLVSSPRYGGATWAIPVAAIPLAFGAAAILALGALPRRPRTLYPDGPMRSENLLGQFPEREEAPAARTVVLVAHHDSKSQTLSFAARALALVAVAAGTAVAVFLLAVRLVFPATGAPLAGAVGPPGAPVAFCAAAAGMALGLAGAALLLVNRTGNASPGALDNAAGLGVLLETARAVRAAPGEEGAILRRGMLYFATGAEEEGMVGAFRSLESLWVRSLPAASTLFVNLDGPGAEGRLFVLEHRGARGDKGAALAIDRAAAETGAAPLRIRFLPGGVDGAVFARGGYTAVTILAGRPAPSLRRVHRPADRLDQVSEASLDRSGRFVLALAAAYLRGAEPE